MYRDSILDYLQTTPKYTHNTRKLEYSLHANLYISNIQFFDWFNLFKIFWSVPEIAIKSYNIIKYDVGHPVYSYSVHYTWTSLNPKYLRNKCKLRYIYSRYAVRTMCNITHWEKSFKSQCALNCWFEVTT